MCSLIVGLQWPFHRRISIWFQGQEGQHRVRVRLRCRCYAAWGSSSLATWHRRAQHPGHFLESSAWSQSSTAKLRSRDICWEWLRNCQFFPLSLANPIWCEWRWCADRDWFPIAWWLRFFAEYERMGCRSRVSSCWSCRWWLLATMNTSLTYLNEDWLKLECLCFLSDLGKAA